MLADAAITGTHADDARAIHEDVLPGEAGEEVDACRLHLHRQPPHEQVERDDVVAVVLQRRRNDRQWDLARLREDVDVLVVDVGGQRRALFAKIRNQIAQSGWIENRAREDVRSRLACFLQDRAELFLKLREAKRG